MLELHCRHGVRAVSCFRSSEQEAGRGPGAKGEEERREEDGHVTGGKGA